MSARSPEGGRRRVRSGGKVRPDRTWLIGAGLVVVCALALVVTRPDSWADDTGEPDHAPLTTASLVCPAAPGPGVGGVTSTSEGASGTLPVREESGKDEIDVTAGEVTPLPEGNGELTLAGRDALAPGLVAGRAVIDPLAVTDCPMTSAEQWFAGLGAGPRHSSSIQVVNPNRGTATVDIDVFSEEGRLDLAELRGVTVPGHSAQTFDLNEIDPRLGDLAARTTVIRGQAVVSVLDRSGPDASEEWLPGQPAPATTLQLMGAPTGAAGQVLTVSNGGDDQISVEIKVITPSAVLEPSDAPSLRVAPESVGAVNLQKVLSGRAAKDVIGIQVEASGPVVASLRTTVEGDAAITSATSSITARSAAVMPTAPSISSKSIALASTEKDTTVTVISRAASGAELSSKDVELAAGQGSTLKLPQRAALVEVTPEGGPIVAAVRLSGRGDAVLPLRPLVTETTLPHVGPGLS